MYFDEDLVLEIRLNTLDQIVDKFVIGEATKVMLAKIKNLTSTLKSLINLEIKLNIL